MDVGTVIFLAFVAAAVIAVLRSFGSSARPLPSPTDYEASPRGDRESSERQKAWVQHVVDGDTVIVSGSWWSETWIRLAHIDCPEDGQEWGNIATAGLIKMIGGRHVYLETHGIDVHGRTLATIYVRSDGQLVNVNERMVMLGHAWVARQWYRDLPERRKQQFDRLERWAKSKRVGLWRTSNPIPPWEWRNGK